MILFYLKVHCDVKKKLVSSYNYNPSRCTGLGYAAHSRHNSVAAQGRPIGRNVVGVVIRPLARLGCCGGTIRPLARLGYFFPAGGGYLTYETNTW